MRSGLLRHRVEIQRATEVRTDSGAAVEEYVTHLQSVAAEIEPLTAREQFIARQVAAEATTRIRIRYRPGINEKMRVVHVKEGGSPTVRDVYDIEGPPIDVRGRRRELHLMCKLRSAEGFRTGPP